MESFLGEGGGEIQKTLETHKIFVYIHFCYVLISRTKISEGGQGPPL